MHYLQYTTYITYLLTTWNYVILTVLTTLAIRYLYNLQNHTNYAFHHLQYGLLMLETQIKKKYSISKLKKFITQADSIHKTPGHVNYSLLFLKGWVVWSRLM